MSIQKKILLILAVIAAVSAALCLCAYAEEYDGYIVQFKEKEAYLITSKSSIFILNIRARLYKFSALGIFIPLSQSYITLGDFNWSKPAKSSWVRADLQRSILSFKPVNTLSNMAF